MTDAASQEVSMPVFDPADPYKVPAFMPSSADKEPRSFSPDAFAIPTRKIDDWRYTPVERISEFFDVFTPSNRTKVSASFIDGSPLSDGVRFRALDKTQAPVGTVLKPSDRAAAVQWVSTEKAYAVEVTADQPSPILINVEGAGLDLDAVQIAITVAADVHADIVVEHSGVARLAEGIELSTGAHSEVSFTSTQEWAKGSKHVGSHRLHVGEGAHLRHSVVTLGGDVVRLRMDQDFGGPEGNLNMLGIYFVDPGQHMEHRTMVVHNYPECKSRVVYKGALDGKDAHSTWVGNALIQPSAPGTDSYELNRNLVLTPGAIADSEPNLEIENGNIVGAGHASSVGRFDDEELFYLQSRGIPEIEARKLVVRGFFGELVDQIGIAEISDHLMGVIDRRLARGESDEMKLVLEEN
ncbi:MAG: Fe-S cluster assembly protein SufD [Bifidobacteriaceae bacterium]|jgi:Fe-S cluster assembly protein SufD|nr:Fe-S cluster assembly protein SufD [Bifidobacteriaceae bacterium]